MPSLTELLQTIIQKETGEPIDCPPELAQIKYRITEGYMGKKRLSNVCVVGHIHLMELGDGD